MLKRLSSGRLFRLVALFGVTLMLAGVLAACGDNTATTAPTTAAATTAAATTAAATTARATTAAATTAAATTAAATTAAATTAAATTAAATTAAATTAAATTAAATTAVAPTAAATAAIPAGAGTEPEKKDLVMALVPSRQSDVIQTQADNIANFLSKETGYNITAKVLTSYAAVGEGMGAKNIDIAWVGPLDYVVAAKKFGVYAITGSVRAGVLGYPSIIVARSDSGINTLADLKGKTIILGDELSASSNLYPRYALQQAGVKPDTDVKVNKITNQSAIAIGVVEKAGDAGAFYSDARTNKEVTDKYPDIQTTTKVIYKSPLIPADPQIVRKDLNAGQVQKIYTAMIKLSNDTDGKKYLKDLFTIDGLGSVKDSDYDGLRDVIKAVKPELLNS